MDKQLIASSELWDEEFYKSQFNIDWSAWDPIEHFIKIGEPLGYPPSIKFSVINYRTLNPDVAEKNINTLYHYLRYGCREARPMTGICEKISPAALHSLHVKKNNLFNAPYEKAGVGIFAFISENTVINERHILLLEGLKEVCDAILFVGGYYIPHDEIAKIRHLIDFYDCTYRAGNKFKCYLTALEVIADTNMAAKAREAIFCTDECLGPFYSLQSFLNNLTVRGSDIYSIGSSTRNGNSLDCSFMRVSRKALQSNNFTEALQNASVIADDNFASLSFFNKLQESELIIGSFIEPDSIFPPPNNSPGYNALQFPISCLKRKSPLININSLTKPPFYNEEGFLYLLAFLASFSPPFFNLARSELKIKKNLKEIQRQNFSIIMATHNRKDKIADAINSALCQSINNFELIIVDDASTDGTSEYILEHYAKLVKSGKIRLFKNKENMRQAYSRNVGLANAKGPWICYLDDDNKMRPHFLEYFALAIALFPETKIFYSQFIKYPQRLLVGREFDYERLLEGNYTDLGVIAYHISLYQEHGGHDTRLKNWDDYDLILKLARYSTPVYLPLSLLDYNDQGHERISNTASRLLARKNIDLKHGSSPLLVSIIRLADGYHSGVRAINSALMQNGVFRQRIILVVGNTTSEVHNILSQYTRRYPVLVSVYTENQLKSLELELQQADYINLMYEGEFWLQPKGIQTFINLMENYPQFAAAFASPSSYTPQKSIYPESTNCASYLPDSQPEIDEFAPGRIIKGPFFNLMLQHMQFRLPNKTELLTYLSQHGIIGKFDSLPLAWISDANI